MAKIYPPKPSLPEEPALEILREYPYYYYAMAFEQTVIAGVCAAVPPEVRAEITDRIQKAVRPLNLSIHFVDQSPYHPI